MKRSYKLVIAVASFSTVGSAYLLGKKEKNLLASWTTNYEPSVKWDSNWDKRDPKSLIHPKSRHASNLAHEQQAVANGEKKSVDDFEINKHSSKATRHLFLIRHGQYEIKASHPDQRVLTQLGQEQAELTGLRLKELATKINFTKLHKSTMIRAVQTADLIKNHLKEDLPVSIDPLLCEGAPIPPEPPVGHWKPEVYFF